MIRFIPAILAFLFTAQAVEIKASTKAQTAQTKDLYPDYFLSPNYVTPNYSLQRPEGETLPGADFNKQVYEFKADKKVWDQNDYEERVKVEAELLVALESLKESVLYLDRDI